MLKNFKFSNKKKKKMSYQNNGINFIYQVLFVLSK